jgi:hypothetical protein
MPDDTHIRVAYLLLVDGYVKHPEGELLIAIADWEMHRTFHAAIDGFFIDCNATGGEPEIAKQMLSSKGIQFTEAK